MKRISLLILGALIACMAVEAKKMSDLTVVVDPGHGGYDGDDRPIHIYPYEYNSEESYWESKSNLVKGLHLKNILDSLGVDIHLTRVHNTYNEIDGDDIPDEPSLATRAKMANNLNADMFISIHSNAGENINYPLMIYHLETDMTPRSTESVRMAEIVNDPRNLNYVLSHRVNGELDVDIISMIAEMENINPTDLFTAFKNKIDNIEGLPEVTEEMTEDEYRLAEYKMLIKTSGGDALDFHAINYPISKYHSKIRKLFKSISLVKKLRETRAFIGFSRLEPNNSASIEDKKSMIRLGNGDWLPAIEVYGEGIFFEFSAEELKMWAKKEEVKKRLQPLNSAYQQSFFAKSNPGNIRAEYVMLHTFAHLIINQLSYECGYGSSSIKERIYCEKCSDDLEMYGVLIYTASGDSEGTLGGLVRRGEPGKLEDTIISALENAKWCSSDPICITSLGQGPESLNRAACHNCALLPETCCECGNRLLDRGLIVGELDSPSIGFFNGL